MKNMWVAVDCISFLKSNSVQASYNLLVRVRVIESFTFGSDFDLVEWLSEWIEIWVMFNHKEEQRPQHQNYK